MGLFDLRCAVSRVSTLWRPAAGGRMTHSMFLVEETGGRWAPCTPPVRGTYDRYGGIELWPEDVSEYTSWVGDRLWSLWRTGALVTSWPEDIEAPHRSGQSHVERMLKHGAETAYNGVTLTIDGRRVGACVVLDAFASAIDAAAPDPPRTLADALARLFPEGGAGRRHFADAPASALPQLSRYASAWAYARARGPVTPIRSGEAKQDSDEAIRRSVQRAWNKDDGPIRAAIAQLEPTWVAGWRTKQARREAEAEDEASHATALAAGTARPYAPGERFVVGELVEHARFGRGRVEAIVEANKIKVRFAVETHVLVQGKALR